MAAAAGADPAERERMTQLVSDLKTLPEQQRSALVLRELSGLGSEEIGSALDISPAAARQAVYEARATLLAQRGGRDMDCSQVQMKLSDTDGRVRRGRRLKAHLADCALCTAFAAAIPARTADMRMVFPPLGRGPGRQDAGRGNRRRRRGGWNRGRSRRRRSRRGRGRQGPTGRGRGHRGHRGAGDRRGAGLARVGPDIGDPARPGGTRTGGAEGQAPPAAKPEPAAAERPPAAVTGYSDLGSGVLGTLEGPGAASGGGAGAPGTSAARTADGGGSLPFTGLDLALLALAGAALLGTGAALRRIASRAAALASEACRTASRARPRPTCSSTRTTPWTGTRGAPRRWPRRASATCRSCCRSATRPATGAT